MVLKSQQQYNLFYDFGRWGYYTNSMEGQVMPGFVTDPPGMEICGLHDIVFAAALRYIPRHKQQTTILLRRTMMGASLSINSASNRRF